MNAQEQIEKVQEFIETDYKKELHEAVQKGSRFIVIDFSLLAQNNIELSEDLLETPEDTLKSFEIAVQQFGIENIDKNFRVRVINLPNPQKTKIRNIRSSHLNKFISFEGIVRQASDVRPQVISAKFECPACGSNITLLQLEPAFREPYRCSCGRKGRFRLLSKELVDSQRLILEESPEALEGGEQPKRLSVFLREDLVEPKMERRTTPGAKVRINGMIKEVSVPSKSGAPSTRFDLACEANFIEPIEETFEEIDITEVDEKKILELAKDPQIYEKLVASIAPSIKGHEDIKGALVLQLMGGVRKELPDGTKVKGDIHILLVGDPGSSKSTLLLFISKVAPKARYIAGKGATAAGLTATVVKDEFLKGWALEAGALVLASGGIACIDEFDKISEEDTSALHEALAQQQISIAKANIQATLRAQTTVLAAANPKLGRFDPYHPIASQIDMPPALINRFDLIFPVRDIPNKEKDEQIASHVLQMYQFADLGHVPIPIDLLKKYSAYARQHIKPKLTKGAVEEIKSFYVNLRNMGTTTGEVEGAVKPIPISARQLESLVILSEASARIRLSDKVTREDAKKAIFILKYCLMQVGFDYETGQIDIDRIATGITSATRNRFIILRDILDKMHEKGKKTIAMEELMAEAHDKGLTESQVEEILDRMKRDGTIFEPKRGFIQKI